MIVVINIVNIPELLGIPFYFLHYKWFGSFTGTQIKGKLNRYFNKPKMYPMKTFILTSIFFLFAFTLMAQVPAGFSYQAVVRNNSGEIVANKTVKFQFSILQNSATGTTVYKETQSKATNEFGLDNLVVAPGLK